MNVAQFRASHQGRIAFTYFPMKSALERKEGEKRGRDVGEKKKDNSPTGFRSGSITNEPYDHITVFNKHLTNVPSIFKHGFVQTIWFGTHRCPNQSER